MTHKQKAIELLSQMPEPYRTMALENLEKFPRKNECEIESIADAINSFWWYKSLQGEDFWIDVFESFISNSPIPELPLEYRHEQLKMKVEKLERDFNKEPLHSNEIGDTIGEVVSVSNIEWITQTAPATDTGDHGK